MPYALNIDKLADGVKLPCVAPLPQGIADHYHPILPRLFFLREEPTAMRDRNS
jgi:hypothetical protein